MGGRGGTRVGATTGQGGGEGIGMRGDGLVSTAHLVVPVYQLGTMVPWHQPCEGCRSLQS